MTPTSCLHVTKCVFDLIKFQFGLSETNLKVSLDGGMIIFLVLLLTKSKQQIARQGRHWFQVKSQDSRVFSLVLRTVQAKKVTMHIVQFILIILGCIIVSEINGREVRNQFSDQDISQTSKLEFGQNTSVVRTQFFSQTFSFSEFHYVKGVPKIIKLLVSDFVPCHWVRYELLEFFRILDTTNFVWKKNHRHDCYEYVSEVKSNNESENEEDVVVSEIRNSS